MKINTIVFDMGGVLLDFGAELFSRRLHVGAEGEAHYLSLSHSGLERDKLQGFRH